MTYIKRAILALVLIAGFTPAIAQVPPPVPALPDTERRTSYSITASTCACAVNFQLFGDGTDFANWVEVFINGTQVNYNDATRGWTITSPSGSLSTLARPITNAVLTFNAAQTGTVQIVGARRPRRTSQFNESAGVPTRNFNQVLTDIISQNREIWDKTNDVTGRAIMAPPGETLNLLASAATRANTSLGFDAFGQIAYFTGGSAVTTSANVTFLQAGTGAVSRTVQDRLRETISAKDFGVRCDGTTNDVAAINLAINAASAAGGGQVVLPSGSCVVGVTNISLKSNVWLRGAGKGATTLKLTALYNGDVFRADGPGLTNIALSDFSFDAQTFWSVYATTNGTTAAGNPVLHFASVPSGISAGMIVRDATTTAAVPSYTHVLSTTSTTVTLGANAAGAGVGTGDTIGFLGNGSFLFATGVTGLVIKNLSMPSIYGFASIALTAVSGLQMSGNDFTAGTFVANQARGCILGFGTLGVTNSTIEKNSFVNCSNEIEGSNYSFSYNFIIPDTGTGIVSGPNPITHTNVYVGNIIHDSSTQFNQDGLLASGMEIWSYNSVVDGNVLYNNACTGMNSGGARNVISNNVIYDNNRAAQSGVSCAAIFINYAGTSPTVSSDSISIVGNNVFNTAGAAGPQVYSLAMNASITNPATVNGNVFGVGSGGTISSAAYFGTNTVNGAQVSGSTALVSGLHAATADSSPVFGLTGLGTGVYTSLTTSVGSSGAFVVNGGPLGVPSSGTATNLTGLPISTGVSGLGTNIAAFLATPSSANLRAALTDEVGAGAAYFVGGALGTPASGAATNLTGLPVSTGISGLGTGVATALAVNVGSAGAPIVSGGDLGTPSAGVATNLTGTAAGLTAGNATKLTTPRAIGIGGSCGLTATGVNFDGSAAINPALAGTTTVACGGTGITSLGTGIPAFLGGGNALTSTPTVLSSTSTGSYTGAFNYFQNGPQINLSGRIDCTTVVSGAYISATLPVNVKSGTVGVGTFYNQTTNVSGTVQIGSLGATLAAFYKYDGTFPCATGQTLWLTGWYIGP